jgi:RNA-directed DNA polymerase
VLDLWVKRWRKREARGTVIIVRYADDFVMGFQYKDDAERCLAELRERFAKFGLEVHQEKTRLIEFGRYAIENREKRGAGGPETFNFLGFSLFLAHLRAVVRGYFNYHAVPDNIRAMNIFRGLVNRFWLSVSYPR